MQTSKYLEKKITANFNGHSAKTVVVSTMVGTAVLRADKNRYLCDKELILCLTVLLKA